MQILIKKRGRKNKRKLSTFQNEGKFKGNKCRFKKQNNSGIKNYSIQSQLIEKVIIFILIENKMSFDKRMTMGILGCLGGMLMHIVIGSFNQWGITNIYITSYYKTIDHTENLEKNAIVYPLMMICIGITMKLGLFLSEKTHPILVLVITSLLQVGVILASSFTKSMGLFLMNYGIFFALFSGIIFMIPVYECNKYFPNKKMYVNGVILMGTGLGPMVFGLYSYNFLNPGKLATKGGYYNGTEQLQQISKKVPEYLRWLGLIYFFINTLGITLLYYVCSQNRRHENQINNMQNIEVPNQSQIFMNKEDIKSQEKQEQNKISEQTASNVLNKLQTIVKKQNNNPNIEEKIVPENDNPLNPSNITTPKLQAFIHQPKSFKDAICSRVWWLEVAIIFFGTCGLFLMNGNYKTYVKNKIQNDQFLTIIGVTASVVNGVCRFFWNVLLNYTGYRFIILLNIFFQIIIYSVLRFSVESFGGFMFLIVLINLCLGGFLGTTPTFVQLVCGVKVGSSSYWFFWEIFGISNMIQFSFVSGLANKIGFNSIIYICLGMAIISGLLVIFSNFQAEWNNSVQYLGYFKSCRKQSSNKQQKVTNQ